MKKKFIQAVLILLTATLTLFAQTKSVPIKWQQIALEVWKAQIGKPESLTLLNAAGAKQDLELLKILHETQFPVNPK